MARLNEAPLPPERPQAESVDALKRRFIRQNRDLARINTHQSLRIRALELDQSRLLSENLSLREEILRLQHKFEDTADDIQLSDLAKVKLSIEQQLAQVSAAVAVLGKIKRPSEPQRQPEPSTWRPAIPTLRLAGAELRMPAILEDKQYPRRTLEPQEISSVRLSDQTTDSPDLGPPPIAHFEYIDPIKYDRPEPIVRQMGEEQDDSLQMMTADLGVNLETRRRRRSSSRPLQSALEEDVVVIPAPEAAPARIGHKRKLSLREEDATTTNNAESFNFTRRATSTPDSTAPSTEIDPPPKLSVVVLDLKNDLAKERKVLGDKSVNTSPRKVTVGKKPLIKTEKGVDGEIKVPKARVRRPLVQPVIPPSTDIEPLLAEIVLPPKTPAASMFSPTPSEPTSEAQDPANNPHDANLEGMTRPSRRARAMTNYAEPRLNSKMRRPTGELVDAIYASKRKTTSKEGSVKSEHDEDSRDDWKAVPQSQLVDAVSPLQGRTSSHIPKPVSPLVEQASSRSGPSAAIKTLRLADRSKSTSELSMPNESDIYNLEGSTPFHSRSNSLGSIKSRRHSSSITSDEARDALNSSPRQKSSLDSSPDVPGEAVLSARPVGEGRSERLASRRRSMIV